MNGAHLLVLVAIVLAWLAWNVIGPVAEQRRWDLLRLPAALVWALRPWWPNHLGRARDRGVAHTPNVIPCRACALESATYLADPYWDDRDVEAAQRRHDAGTYVPGHGPQEPRRARTL